MIPEHTPYTPPNSSGIGCGHDGGFTGGGGGERLRYLGCGFPRRRSGCRRSGVRREGGIAGGTGTRSFCPTSVCEFGVCRGQRVDTVWDMAQVQTSQASAHSVFSRRCISRPHGRGNKSFPPLSYHYVARVPTSPVEVRVIAWRHCCAGSDTPVMTDLRALVRSPRTARAVERASERRRPLLEVFWWITNTFVLETIDDRD